MKRTIRLSLVLLGALAQKRLYATETIDAGAALAFPSVQEASSARAIALGSTYVGIAEGSATLPRNPAGLAGLKATEVAIHHNGTVAGSFQENAILGLPMGQAQGLGISVNYGDSGEFEGRDAAGNLTNNYAARAYGASVGWGMQLPKEVALGAALKFNRQDLAGVAFNAFAADLGALWKPTPNLLVGAAYTNLGPEVAGGMLSQGFSLGASSYFWKDSDLQLLGALSGESLTRGGDSVHVGIEGTLFKMLALRSGYVLDIPGQAGRDALLGWTFGGGVQLESLSLDYAVVPMADLGNVQRVSLTYAFGASNSSK